MDGFFRERFLGEIFWDEPLPPASQSGFFQYTNPPRIRFGQETSHLESNSQNMKDKPLPPANQSAFVGYREVPITGFGQESPQNKSSSKNMSKRIIIFLRKSWPVERTKTAEYEGERCFRHMINERMRRQRQRQCYWALHSMLPNGTKTENNSIVQTAANEIQRLRGCRDELQRKYLGLEAKLKAKESSEAGGGKVQFRLANPASGIESMVEALKCLKSLGVNAKSIKSNFSHEELFAMIKIDTKIADDEVERAIQRKLDEVGRKQHSHVREGSKRQKI